MQNYRLKIDVTKLDEEAFFKGAKGTYVDLVLWLNDGEDQYGNIGTIQQDLGKEAREQGRKGAYVGSAKPLGSSGGGGKPRRKPDIIVDNVGDNW